MQVESIQLDNQHQLMKDYRNYKDKIMKYFSYLPFDNFEQRVDDLRTKEFNRDQLTDVLHAMNEQWHAPMSTYDNIERLKNNESVTVIGGQQAGLLSGPMYTINKIISIIQLAKQQESKLGVPVIPIFWIAGEDHDFEEINHIYLRDDWEMKKHHIEQIVPERQTVSETKLDKDDAENWLNELFESLEETLYTKNLYETIKMSLENAPTYVDFFALLIYELFSDEGLILIDSAHPALRQLESGYFIQMIEQQEQISVGIYEAFQQLQRDGYSVDIDVETNDAHLFYHQNNERLLLKRTSTDEWTNEQYGLSLSTEELLLTARERPELLSNNVMSRPLMQEFLFPNLAFVGGGGEIGYWAVLKSAFESLNLNMPPVVPRLSFTYIDQQLKNVLASHSIDEKEIIRVGANHLKINWLASQSTPPIKQVVTEIKKAINDVHEPLRTIALDIRSDIGDIANKNLDHLYRELDYLEHRMMGALEEKYDKELKDFAMMTHYLHPFNGLQERIWNPLPLINKHGLTIIKRLANESFSFQHEHYIVYI